MAIASVYGNLLRVPGIRRQTVTGVVAQVTQTVAVGIALVVHGATGSLAAGGVAAAAFALGVCVARPVQGRALDRRGVRPVLVACALVHAAALCALAVAAFGDNPVRLDALALLCGFSLPPISLAMRAEWGRSIEPMAQSAAFSLATVVQELAVFGGPLLLAVVIAASSPRAAVAVLGLVACVGTLGFALSLPAVVEGAEAGGYGRRPAGALLALVAISFLLGAALGAVQVSVAAVATEHTEPALAGILIAVMSVGGLLGGLTYGAVRPSSAAAGDLGGALVLLTVAGGVLALVGSVPATAALLFAAGLGLNPAITAITLQVRDLGAGAEGFGWLSAGTGSGTALGAALAGYAAQRAGDPGPGFAVAAASCALGVLLVWITPRR
jgi:predicted MFS family arabinose efflux permease